MRRYLPLALLTTGLVMVLPAVLVSTIVSRGGALSIVASGLCAVGLSMAIATAGAALWKRQPHSRDIVFSDLLLWGWIRRCWTERRLSQARELYDSARKSGPAVSIDLLTGLSRLLEARDAYTHGHGQRVSRHAAQMARAMHLSPVEVAKIRTAATVHDIGKLYTPREILNNPNRLSEAEFDVAKRHAAWGARMLANVGDPEIAAMVGHHHERMDGGGYPDRLAGSEIPLGARIIAVADTFDAITSCRSYRPARTQKQALDVLSKEAGSQLDAAAVAAFRSTYTARRSIAWVAIAAGLPQRLLAGVQSASQSVGAGAAALLPGVGAAGLLALSPGLHHKPVSAHPASPSPAAHRLAAPGRATAASKLPGRTAEAVRGGRRRNSGPVAHISPRPPAPANTGTRTTAPSPGTGGGGSSSSGGTPRPPAPSPLPPQPVSPPAVEVPAVPAPPATGPVTVPTGPVTLPTVPVTLPTVPGVNLSPVKVPKLPAGVIPGT